MYNHDKGQSHHYKWKKFNNFLRHLDFIKIFMYNI